MSNVIEIAKFRRDPNEEPRWICDLSVFETSSKTHGNITAANVDDDAMEAGERLHMVADRLDDLSFIMRQQAEQDGSTDRGQAIATVVIFEDGSIRVRTDEHKVVSSDQKRWVVECLELAKTVEQLTETE